MNIRLLCGTLLLVMIVAFVLPSVLVEDGGGARSDELGSESQISGIRDSVVRDQSQRSSTGNESYSRVFRDFSEDEKLNDIHSRLNDLAVNESLFFKESYIEELVRDLSDQSFQAREAFQGRFSGLFLNLIDLDSSKKLDRFSEAFLATEAVLGKHRWEGVESSTYILDQVVGHSFRKKYNLFNEINKLESQDSRRRLASRIVPQAMVYFEDGFEDVLKTLPQEDLPEVEQQVMVQSARTGGYLVPSLEICLNGGGHSGTHSKIVEEWFSQPKEIWEKSQEIESVINEAQSGPRKDTLIANLITVVAAADSGVARDWVEKIENPEVKQEALKAVERLAKAK